MALFTDGPLSSIQDLSAYDSQLLDVASAEGIDLTRKLTAAQDDQAVELSVLLANLRFADQPLWLTPSPKLGNVVVTQPLKLWHAYLSLEMVYRDAYNSELNDRYAGKRDQFRQLAEWAREKFIQSGVGVAVQPVAQAATPYVITIPGTLADGTYFVTMAWVNAAGEEGASAVPAVITISGSALQVQPAAVPENATGWNVYIGNELETMILQNQSPIGVGAVWQQPTPLATSGPGPGTGQNPTYLKPLPRIIQRG
jgi:hypothetical protein